MTTNSLSKEEKFKQYIKIAISDDGIVGLGINALDYLKWYEVKSREKPSKLASVREMRQWILDGAVLFRNPDTFGEYEGFLVDNPYETLKLPLQAILFPKKSKVRLPVLNVKLKMEYEEIIE